MGFHYLHTIFGDGQVQVLQATEHDGGEVGRVNESCLTRKMG
jgi:hypothetical protein